MEKKKPHKKEGAYVYKNNLGSSDGKESICNTGDPGSILGLGGSPGEGNGLPAPYFAWEIPWTEEPGELPSTESQRVGHD